jgi:NitT/TauT family transport system substrate-binding protein
MSSALTFLAVLSLLLGACAQTPAATSSTAPATGAASASPTLGPVVKLTFAVSGTSPLTVAYKIAKDGGFWDKQNLDVTLTQISGDPAITQAVVSGQAQVGAINGTGFFNAVAAGGDLLLIGSLLDSVTDYMVVTSDIKAGADLKGKKVAISTVGSENERNSMLAVKGLGLDPAKDVTFLPVGGEGPRLAALKAGTVSAGALGIGNEEVVKQAGLHILSSMYDLKLPAITAGFGVLPSWYNANKDVAKRFLTGFIQAIAYFKTNKQGSLPLMSDYLQQKDMTIVSSSYDAVAAVYRREPSATLAGAQSAIDFTSATTPAAKNIDPKKYIDNSILDQLQSSGFIDSLYK